MEQENKAGLALSGVGVIIAMAVAVWVALSGGGTPTPQVAEGYVLYEDSTYSFTVEVPKDFIIDENYELEVNSFLKSMGVSFKVPTSFTEGTNLSADTYMTVEWIPVLSSCSPQHYLNPVMGTSTVTQNGTVYDVATSMDAGAGNFYEQIVYMAAQPGSCLAVRYFIHTTNINNYPEGTVREYDRAALLEIFDRMRFSIKRPAPAGNTGSEPAVNQ